MKTPTDKRWSSRKFATMAVALVVFTSLLVSDQIGEQTYSYMTMAVLLTYLGVNAAQHILEKKR